MAESPPKKVHSSMVMLSHAMTRPTQQVASDADRRASDAATRSKLRTEVVSDASQRTSDAQRGARDAERESSADHDPAREAPEVAEEDAVLVSLPIGLDSEPSWSGAEAGGVQ
jgi:hypothetical protein